MTTKEPLVWAEEPEPNRIKIEIDGKETALVKTASGYVRVRRGVAK